MALQLMMITFKLACIKGDFKLVWLQPPCSAASCSQHIYGNLYITVECCIILDAASGHAFETQLEILYLMLDV